MRVESGMEGGDDEICLVRCDPKSDGSNECFPQHGSLSILKWDGFGQGCVARGIKKWLAQWSSDLYFAKRGRKGGPRCTFRTDDL